MRTLFHASSYPFRPEVGEEIVLRPGTQNAQGVGVYLSEGAPDVRASDSVYANGLAALFELAVESATLSSEDWYRSKGCRDRAKGRPRTWHTKGKYLRVRVTGVDGIRIIGTAELIPSA